MELALFYTFTGRYFSNYSSPKSVFVVQLFSLARRYDLGVDSEADLQRLLRDLEEEFAFVMVLEYFPESLVRCVLCVSCFRVGYSSLHFSSSAYAT
jgi:hypothetical protein